jgi:hypothetical protein
MTLNAQFGCQRCWTAAWAAVLLLTLAHFGGLLHRGPGPRRGSHRRDVRPSLPANGGPAIFASNDHSEVTNYFLDFAGDRSLDVATVVEQSSAGYTKYTVHLHLASGAEQSVVVAAPPGGLQVEMHDMTGDKVQNDVVLRPALVRWLPTVLVNDGHEHFEVAISATGPSSFSSSEDLGSRRRESQTFALLMSSGFKAVHLLNSRRPFDPQLRECLFSSFTQTVTNRLGLSSTPGRAPPYVTTI